MGKLIESNHATEEIVKNIESWGYAYESSFFEDTAVVLDFFEERISIDCSEFIPNDYHRKTLLNIEIVDSLQESSIRFKSADDIKEIVQKTVKMNCSRDNLSWSLGHLHESFSLQTGEYDIRLFVAVDYPLIARNSDPADEAARGLIRNSEILNVYVVISKSSNGTLVSEPNHLFYESYSGLGFLIADVDVMDRQIRKYSDANNIFEAFTTTELASDLFNAGVMALCWGMTPWTYFIISEGESSAGIPVYKGQETEYSGLYKFSEDVSEVSVIPGNALENWEQCRKTLWPKIKISGKGGFLNIRLFVIDILSKDGASSIPVPSFYIKRTDGDETLVSPLLTSNIFE